MISLDEKKELFALRSMKKINEIADAMGVDFGRGISRLIEQELQSAYRTGAIDGGDYLATNIANKLQSRG